jgi:cytochrome c
MRRWGAALLIFVSACGKPIDTNDGKSLFKYKCGGCHVVSNDQGRGVGPNLGGVFGSKIAGGRYSYSDALKSKAGVWDEKALDQWLESPNVFAPGSRMSFAGIKDYIQRTAIIEYLKKLPK